MNVSTKEAKRDERLRSSGRLTAFEYGGKRWATEPKSAFYDYIYIKSALASFTPEELKVLDDYVWFADIEFNPCKSINSQARSVALLKAVIADKAQNTLDYPDKCLQYHKKKSRFSY